jgi:hypothetical protein
LVLVISHWGSSITLYAAGALASRQVAAKLLPQDVHREYDVADLDDVHPEFVFIHYQSMLVLP